MDPRKIIHLDMDAFYASVEQRDDPSLRGRPLAVGGDPSGRGVVAAASYEARAFGVRSAMPAAEARRRCPDLIFRPPDMARYRAVSAQMRAILEDYTDIIEPLALDECYLDVTTNKVGIVVAREVAADIRRRIKAELGLTASAGVGPSKLVAKIASDWDKPDGLTVVEPGDVLAFLHPLTVDHLWGVGPATQRKLEKMGLRTVGDVAARPRRELERALGKQGAFLWRMANGDDSRPVRTERVRKSRGAERTFARDVTDLDELRAVLDRLVQSVVQGMWTAGRRARTITLKVRYADFTTITRSTSLDHATDRAEEVMAAVDGLLRKTEAGERPVRLVGVSLAAFEDASARPTQLQLPWGPVSEGR